MGMGPGGCVSCVDGGRSTALRCCKAPASSAMTKWFAIAIAFALAGCPSQGTTVAKPPTDNVAPATSVTSTPSASAALGSTPPVCPTAACGPAPAYPTGACPDGVHVRGRGPCTQFADGSC